VKGEASTSHVWWLAAGSVALMFSSGACRSNPELTRADAAALISGARQFNESRLLVSVDSVGCGSDSDSSVCWGGFTFEQSVSAGGQKVVKASAQFGYWKGKWHLRSFRYGDSPPYVAVQVDPGTDAINDAIRADRGSSRQ